MGASLAWVGPARGSRVQLARAARPLSPRASPRAIPIRTASSCGRGVRSSRATRQLLTVEVAEDEAFRRVVAHAQAPVSAARTGPRAFWSAGSSRRATYWYRFTDADGNGSRVGRTITAPRPNDPRPVNFAFVSCQDVNEGKLNAYRRMIFEDERAPAGRAARLRSAPRRFHLRGRPVSRRGEDPLRPHDLRGRAHPASRTRKVGNFHIPLTVDGYRAVYKGYLADPDLQDARARWPFVCIWDNHEFSWQGWQSIVQAGGADAARPDRQGRRQPGLVRISPGARDAPSGSLAEFDPPAVKNVKIEQWDENGLGLEPNNLTAIRSLIAYRALRYGQHLDLIITDQHSFSGDRRDR